MKKLKEHNWCLIILLVIIGVTLASFLLEKVLLFSGICTPAKIVGISCSFLGGEILEFISSLYMLTIVVFCMFPLMIIQSDADASAWWGIIAWIILILLIVGAVRYKLKRKNERLGN